jgi:hypothetical protein
MAKKKTTKALETKPKLNPKGTAAEVESRVTEVQNWLLLGYTRHEILRFSSDWNVSSRTIDEYLARATVAIKAINKVSVQENMAIITAQLWESFRRGRATADEAHCLKVLTQLSKIKGLEKNTLNLIVEDKRDLEDLSDEELDQILAETSGVEDLDEYEH